MEDRMGQIFNTEHAANFQRRESELMPIFPYNNVRWVYVAFW